MTAVPATPHRDVRYTHPGNKGAPRPLSGVLSGSVTSQMTEPERALCSPQVPFLIGFNGLAWPAIGQRGSQMKPAFFCPGTTLWLRPFPYPNLRNRQMPPFGRRPPEKRRSLREKGRAPTVACNHCLCPAASVLLFFRRFTSRRALAFSCQVADLPLPYVACHALRRLDRGPERTSAPANSR